MSRRLPAGENNVDKDRLFTRRAFLHRGTLFLAGPSLAGNTFPGLLASEDDGGRPKGRIGLVTDLHYADKVPAIHRHYRETLPKFAQAARQFRQDKTDVVIELHE